MRINKFISANSGISRRKADELIEAGEIFVNDKQIKTQGIQVNPEKDIVKIGGEIIEQKNDKIYLALNKPARYVSTRKDEKDRKTVMELVPSIANLKPAGRLDKESEGLLLFSNDGEFINKITHPKFECEKEYYVIVDGNIEEKNKEKLEKGVKIDGYKTSKSKITVIKRSKTKTALKITIHEGRNRQVRKMFASTGHNVKYLQRIRIGKIKLGGLPKGKYRQLTQSEINVN